LDKVRNYWEYVGGTHWKIGEHSEKPLRTFWEHIENNKGPNNLNTPPRPPLSFMRKKIRAHLSHFGSLHWLPRKSMPKLPLWQFWSRLMPRAQTVGEPEPKTTSKKKKKKDTIEVKQLGT
jgi:hypothetical protein